MNSKLFLTGLVCVLAAMGCSKPNAQNSEQQIVNALDSKSWCTVDHMDTDYQIVTRFQFKTDATLQSGTVSINYLRLNGQALPVGYPVDHQFPFFRQTVAFNPTGYSVDFVGDAAKVTSLAATTDQKAIFDKVLRMKNLKIQRTFSPSEAVVLRSRGDLLNSKTDEQTLYPCGDYASEFATTPADRPLIEFSLFLGQALYRDSLARAMSFRFPLEVIDAEPLTQSGAKWCSWLQLEPSHLNFHALSFGSDEFVDQDGSDFLFSGIPKEAFNEMADNALIQTITSRSPDLISTYSLTGLPNLQDRFTAIRDANGVEALIKVNAQKPYLSLAPIFSDIYFRCDDQRPMKVNPALKQLPRFLDLLKSKLGSHYVNQPKQLECWFSAPQCSQAFNLSLGEGDITAEGLQSPDRVVTANASLTTTGPDTTRMQVELMDAKTGRMVRRAFVIDQPNMSLAGGVENFKASNGKRYTFTCTGTQRELKDGPVSSHPSVCDSSSQQ